MYCWLDGKTVVVTGASGGMGAGIAATLIKKHGCTVIGVARSEPKMLKFIEELGPTYAQQFSYKLFDVSVKENWENFYNELVEEGVQVDVLVNNAGIIKRIPMCEMTAAQFRQVIDVDLNAPFIVAKAVIPDMIEQGGGKIINICSMMSELGRETVSAYAAAKGGLKMLTKNIASEYGQYNIQCNGIGPGYIATPQTAPLREIQPDGSRHPFDQFIVAKTPAARWGNAEDLGGPAVFLASEASDFVNGLILYVDGGILAYIGKQPG